MRDSGSPAPAPPLPRSPCLSSRTELRNREARAHLRSRRPRNGNGLYLKLNPRARERSAAAGGDGGGGAGERRQGQLLRHDAMHGLRPQGKAPPVHPTHHPPLTDGWHRVELCCCLQVVALANLIPLDDSVDELDSYMYQTVCPVSYLLSLAPGDRSVIRPFVVASITLADAPACCGRGRGGFRLGTRLW